MSKVAPSDGVGAGSSSKKIPVITLLAGLAIGFGVGVGAGYALGKASCSDSTNSQIPASPSSPPNPSQQVGGGCSNKDGRDETDTMMTLLTSPPKIRLNEDSVADLESYCAVLISFASMDDASRNTMIFGTSDPINDGVSADAPALASKLSGKLGGGKGKGAGGSSGGKGNGRRRLAAGSIDYTVDVATDVGVQVGEDIDGEAATDNFGNTVALSSDAYILAAGVQNADIIYDGTSYANGGKVRVYAAAPRIFAGHKVGGAGLASSFSRRLATPGWPCAATLPRAPFHLPHPVQAPAAARATQILVRQYGLQLGTAGQ